MHLQENTLFDLDLRVKVTRYVAQVTTSKGLGGEAVTRKFNI